MQDISTIDWNEVWKEQMQERYRFILVDEFQDANYAQVKILRMLAGEPRNVFAVGDPDQAIYAALLWWLKIEGREELRALLQQLHQSELPYT